MTPIVRCIARGLGLLLVAAATTGGAFVVLAAQAEGAPDPERLAERFGWVAALVVVAFFVLLGLVALVLRSLLKAQRRQEAAAIASDRDRRASEVERDRQLREAIMDLTKSQGQTRDAVTRQTAVQLATQRAEPALIEEIVRRLTAPGQLCSVCPLADLPEEDRRLVAERSRWCLKNYAECLVNQKRQGG